MFYVCVYLFNGRSLWNCGLRCRSAATRLLGSGVWIQLSARMFVSSVCCEELITRSEESYRVFVLVCDTATWNIRLPRNELGCFTTKKKVFLETFRIFTLYLAVNRHLSEVQTSSHLLSRRINLLKPTGHVMHQQFNIQQLYALPTLYLRFVFIWEQTATFVPYSINWLVFITEMKSVYCAVRNGSLNKAVCASSLKG